MPLNYPLFTTETIFISGKSIPSHLFNIFPCGLFKQLTTINEILLEVEYVGEGLLEISYFQNEKRKMTKSVQLVKSEIYNVLKFTLSFDFWDAVHVKITDFKNLKLKKFQFESDVSQNPNINLGIVICTFKKEDYVKKIIESLNSFNLSFLAKLKIIDNGNSVWPEMNSKIPMSILPNRNLGGAGGFTRGIREVLLDPDITHVLLMDDDIHLEPLFLNRLAFFISVQSNMNTVISGGMYDLMKPSILYEGNSRCSNNKFGYKASLFNLNLNKVEDFQRQFNWSGPDFAPWWFAAFPVSVVKEIGLPLPLFIRGDDLEYGLRMKKWGCQIINFPGVGVWHEPFYVKNPAWIYFYHIRNFFIINAIHGQVKEFSAVLSLVFRVFLNIISYKYNQANQILDGWEQFLEGPESFLKKKPEEIHSLVLGKVNSDIDCKVYSRENFLSAIGSNHSVMHWKKEWELRKIPFVFFFSRIEINVQERITIEVYSRNLSRGLRMFLRMVSVFYFWFKNRKKVSRDWAAQFSHLNSESFWKEYSHA